MSSRKKIPQQNGKRRCLTAKDRELLAAFQCARDLIRDRTRGVADGYHVGCYLLGRPGSSRTSTVIETLEELRVSWVYRNSRMSAAGLYVLLEEHPEHVVVLDDIPNLFTERQALQILTAALGGRAGQPRPVTYTIKDERRSFDFFGGIVAVSNLPLRRDPLADAVASRVVMLEHEPSDEMLAAFMRQLALQGYQDLGPQECLDVVEFLVEEASTSDYRLNLWFLEKAWQDYRLAKHGNSQSPWKELVRSSMQRVANTRRAKPVGREERKASEQEIALDLFTRFPSGRQKSQRDAEWQKLTGKKADALYRRKRELEADGRL